MSDLLVPIAVSSQLDVTGEEKIHAAKWDKVVRPVFVPKVPFLYVADNTNNRVQCMTLAGTVVATITGINKPFFLAASVDGSKMYVGSNQGSTITEIDTQTNIATRSVAPGFLPEHLVVDPVRPRLYAPLYSTGQVARIDTDTFTVINLKTVTNQPRQAAITPDGSTLYISNGAGTGNTAYMLDTTSDTSSVTTASLAVGFPDSVRISPDGTKIIYTSYPNRTIVVCSLPDRTILSSTVASYTPVSVSFSSDSSKYYITSTDATIHVFSATTFAQINQITGFDSNIADLYIDAPRGIGYAGDVFTNGAHLYRVDLVNDVKLSNISCPGAAFSAAVGMRYE